MPKCKRLAKITWGIADHGRTTYASSGMPEAGVPGWMIALHLSPSTLHGAGAPVVWPEANSFFWPHTYWREPAGKLQNPGVHSHSIFSLKWNFPLESGLMSLMRAGFFFFLNLLRRTDVEIFVCIYQQISLKDAAISQKVCQKRCAQRCRESCSRISHIHTCK